VNQATEDGDSCVHLAAARGAVGVLQVSWGLMHCPCPGDNRTKTPWTHQGGAERHSS
jgi:hypothetical protein